jgi:uncharacterized membrane protein YdjX (TVP38/TMEM64 family)
MKNLRKLIGLVLFGAIVAILWAFTPMRALFDKSLLVMHLKDLGDWAIPSFLIGYTIATVLGVPATVLTIAGGAVFGLLVGTLLTVVGATVGAIGAFLLARYLLHDWAEHHFGNHKRLAKLRRTVQNHPLRSVLVVRFANIVPFNLANFLLGLTPIDFKSYTIGTFFGIIPGSLVYTGLGVAGMQALNGGDRLPLFTALGVLLLVTVVPLLLKNRFA